MVAWSLAKSLKWWTTTSISNLVESFTLFANDRKFAEGFLLFTLSPSRPPTHPFNDTPSQRHDAALALQNPNRCACFSEYPVAVFRRVPGVSASTRCVCFSDYPLRVFQRVPGVCVSVSTRCFSEYSVFQRVPGACVSASTRCVCFSEYPVRVFQRVPAVCVSVSTRCMCFNEYPVRVFQ